MKETEKRNRKKPAKEKEPTKELIKEPTKESKELAELNPPFIEESWYQDIVEDIKASITEILYIRQIETIRLKWEVGNTIFMAREYIERYGSLKDTKNNVIKQLSKDVGISERELYRCLAFREKFDSFKEIEQKFPKNVSWHKLVNQYVDFEFPKPVLDILSFPDEFGLLRWWRIKEKERGGEIKKVIVKSNEIEFEIRKK